MNWLLFLAVLLPPIFNLVCAQAQAPVYSYTLVRHDGHNSTSSAWMFLETTDPTKAGKYFSFSAQPDKNPWKSAPGISSVNDTIRFWPYSSSVTRLITLDQFNKMSNAIDQFYAKEPYYQQSPPVKSRNTYNSFQAVNYVLRAGGNIDLIDDPFYGKSTGSTFEIFPIQWMLVTVAAVLAFC